jgi:alpha-ketoglutarate-dependent taurine dioxygenase
MSATVAGDRRAWRAATIDPSASWYYPLSATCLEALERRVRTPRADGTTSLVLDDATRAACADSLAPVRDALESGRGFAILDRLPMERCTDAQAVALYWLIGQGLGRPFAQNVQGTLLYDVRDTGQDVRYGARFSVTSAESSFHTDNSFGDEVLDYVGLLCLRTARSGGVNQVVSAWAVWEELAAHHPDVLAVLARPFHVDRRGGVRPGQGPTALVPVLQRHGPEVLVRYLRYWVQAGHEKAGQPLTAEQVRALDVLDGLLQRRDLIVEFAVQPGQIFLMNNRWLLHNRTAFEDHAEPEKKRHLVRLWLQRHADGPA